LGRRYGLTLVEILVVIGIIAILAGILIPVIGRARAHGRRVQCIANLRQFDMAFKGQNPNKPDTRLPLAEMWVGAIAGAADGAYKILRCPDGSGASDGMASADSAYFHAWSGKGASNPNGSRLNGNAPWRQTRSAPAADGSFTISWKMKPGGPSLVVNYLPVGNGGNIWRAVVSKHPGAPYRVDAIITSDGRRFARVMQGFTVDYDITQGGLDYGFNSLASGLDGAKSGKIVAMDFDKPVFDFDGWQTASEPDDYLPAKVLSRRHLKQINALLSDGAVVSYRPDEIPPADGIYAIAPTRGPNPGSPEPTGAANNGNGNNGNGNGNGPKK
jgi:prepilin-type N-terminal cleavage/methylation domain-containing protein